MEENRLRDISIAISLAVIEIMVFSIFIDLRFKLHGLSIITGFSSILLGLFVIGPIFLYLMWGAFSKWKFSI